MNIVFLIGTGRCGSTLVHELLCRNENAGFISNFDDRLASLNMRGRFNSAIYRNLPQSFTRKGRMRFAPSEAYNLIGKATAIYASPSRDLISNDVTPWQKKVIGDLFTSRQRAQNKEIFTHKYTGWSRIGFFAEIFENAKFVHIVRDGRSVANSFMQMPWWNGYSGPHKWLYGELDDLSLENWKTRGSRFHELGALSWKMLINSYPDPSDPGLKSRYMLVRYEDFIENHIECIKSIASFSDLPVSNAFVDSISRIKIYRNRKSSYLDDLFQNQLTDIEALISPELEKYGYI